MNPLAKADTLRRELFVLLGKFKAFEQELNAAGEHDASGDANQAGCELARAYEAIAAVPLYQPGGPSGDFTRPAKLLPARLRELIAASGRDLNAIAKDLGVSRQAVYNLLNGTTTDPAWSLVQKIAAVFEVTTDSLRSTS